MYRRTLAVSLIASLAVVVVGAAGASASASPASASQASPWIHVRVTEGGDGAKVNVNLPLSMVDVAVDILEANEHFEHGRIRLGKLGHHRHGDIGVEDLRRAWKELRAAGDGEFVTVEDGDDRVVVSRRGSIVRVEVSDGDDEQVLVEVPVEIVDALLEGEGDELDVRGALQKLSETTRGQIVSVRDGETEVRVWIDESATQ